MMIKSFRHSGLRSSFLDRSNAVSVSASASSSPIRVDVTALPRPRPAVSTVLSKLDEATSIDRLRLPGLRALPIDNDEFWQCWGVPVDLSGHMVVFRFEGNHVHDVDLIRSP